MIETLPTVDSGCPTCHGARWLRRPVTLDTPANTTVRLVRCPDCNPAPLDQVRKAENARAFGDEQPRRRGKARRREWWAE